VDIHAHFVPDFYRQALAEAGLSHPDGIPAVPVWSEKAALAAMDRLGIRTAILSISSPGVHFGDPAAARLLARQVNEEAARIRDNWPGRFGFFASLPGLDVDAAVTELRYALDVLGADGVVLETNSAGRYLGHPSVEPIYAEINRRRSVLFIHPTASHCSQDHSLGYPHPMLEFMFETTRSVTDLVLSGVLDRHPAMNVVVPHAGAALPVLADRVDLILPMLGARDDHHKAADQPRMRSALRRLHFDLAGAPVPVLLDALLATADPTKIHYGSDFPFTPLDVCDQMADQLADSLAVDDDIWADILLNNSVAMFPRLNDSR
jgi:predicted TIM-barrel fold metal-dependent hydrolase